MNFTHNLKGAPFFLGARGRLAGCVGVLVVFEAKLPPGLLAAGAVRVAAEQAAAAPQQRAVAARAALTGHAASPISPASSAVVKLSPFEPVAGAAPEHASVGRPLRGPS
jgi:hypothetical protein